MEAFCVDHEKSADGIYDTLKVLIDKDNERGKQLNSTSIHRVPETLRNVNKSSYTPRVVSIGPFHAEEEGLKGVEMHKVSYMCDLFRRLSSPPEETMKACVSLVLPKLDQIKACYQYQGEMKEFDNNEYVKMMVIDACFILELIYKSTLKKSESLSFFANNLLTLYVKHDLLLLENQIPFFVLQDIFYHTIRLDKPGLSLANLVLTFLKDMNPFGKQLKLDKDALSTKHDHILGLLQKCYQHAHAMSSQQSGETSNSAAEFLNAVSYSVTDLSLAGVKFKPNTNEAWLLDMEFRSSRIPFIFCSWRKPTFKMPYLQIEDYTESVLRNLIAYEQCSPMIPNYVTSYAFAMERILDTKEDVHKLIESKVLVNNLGSSEQASNMINSICKEVTVKDFIYIKQWQQLEEYYNGYWPKNVAWLRRTYFNTPWSFIALLAGFLLFGLTVAQTYFTIRPM